MAKKILIADDDRTLVKLLEATLQDAGYETVVAYDGEEALGKISAERPDLLILDVDMPKLNGYSFLFEMRALEERAPIPVMVLTCKEGMADIFKAEGVKEYLIKPVGVKDLLERVRRHI
ncbi:MAG: response regulator [Elusimicrobia bacterium]|nr:response regulator [Elusimicrobiota bacterium]